MINGKGDLQRKRQISYDEYCKDWDEIFSEEIIAYDNYLESWILHVDGVSINLSDLKEKKTE